MLSACFKQDVLMKRKTLSFAWDDYCPLAKSKSPRRSSAGYGRVPKDNLGRGAIDEARALTGDIGACVERMCAIKEIEYEDDGKKVQPIARMLGGGRRSARRAEERIGQWRKVVLDPSAGNAKDTRKMQREPEMRERMHNARLLADNIEEMIQDSQMKSRLSNSILVGDVVGMIFFGLCIDRWGRKLGIIATTAFLVFGIILATASHGTTPTGMLWMMVVARGVAGVGAGGEYARAEKPRCSRCQSTNVAIVSGFVGSSIVSIIVIAAYHSKASDGIWRICFGIGIFLPLVIFFFRMRLVNSTQYQKHAIQRKFPLKLACVLASRPSNALLILLRSDVVVYPFNLLAPTIVSGFSDSNTLLSSTGWSALVNAFALPALSSGASRWFRRFLIDRMGRRQTYALGFSIVSVFGFIIGGAMIPLQATFPAFVVLFGLFQSFLSVGPGRVVPHTHSRSLPRVFSGSWKRRRCYRYASVPHFMGKFDTPVKGQQAIFLVASAICALGTLVVWFLIPDRDTQLENEDALFKKYLEENGWDTSDMGLCEDVRSNK
ncbi:major facilitator superfamily domain-containing protein [Mucidula mucida]|nr:major facilitator superfamily domain-containing protein [Mucidula mucida]